VCKIGVVLSLETNYIVGIKSNEKDFQIKRKKVIYNLSKFSSKKTHKMGELIKRRENGGRELECYD
jgi:hypothetical protein